MAKHLLHIEYDYDFLLVAISCHQKDYKTSWALNKALNINLVKQPDLKLQPKKEEELNSFSRYFYHSEDNELSYWLIANRSVGGQLINEEKTADYLLIVKGPQYSKHLDEIITKIREIEFVNTAYEVNPYALKTKENLLF